MSETFPIIDAHHHIWDLERNRHPWLQDEPMIPFRYGDYSAIRRSYMPADYRRDSARQNVVASVYVEAEWNPADPLGETRFVHEIAARDGLPNAIVAQAWLDREDVADVIAGQAAFPLVRSIRHKPKSAARSEETTRGASGSMDDPRWRAGFALLARHRLHFDLQTPWWHFDAAADLARDFGATTIIINHTGLPSDRSPEALAAWRSALAHVAEQPNVHLKISGIGLRGVPWTVANNGAIVRDAIRIFGADRCVFASNFPVDSLTGSFDDIFDGFKTITADMSASDRRALFHDNAARIYRPTRLDTTS
jgi:predicted TIM-barrel fold metal-dependent hydrolase